MKNLSLIVLLAIISVCVSCKSNDIDNTTQEQDAEKLNQMFIEIKTLSHSVSCNDATQWTFTSYGSKACGGPIGYIAYSTTINVSLFLEKIQAHKIAQAEFNKKWGIVSDCSIPAQPNSVICENGLPILDY